MSVVLEAITGESLIGGDAVRGSGDAFNAWNPEAAAPMDPAFHTAGAEQIDAACRLANEAFDIFRNTTDEERARFLDTVAEQIEALGDTLIERAMAETALPRGRLEFERKRTVNQLKLFGTLLREGSWRDARLDTPLPERAPPRPDLRYRLIGVGPVAVFGASNFPLAFSVAGGDTASAFAAGCPVVLKAHPAHPGTSELVGRAVARAVELSGLPAGVFALLTGVGNALGQSLVAHPAIQAVGFTGSRFGGLALMAVAAARPQPIPVYAEMSSINPLFVLPAALRSRGATIARDFAGSLTLGVGQFCTNPGLVLGIAGPEFEQFAHDAAAALGGVAAGSMLTPGIAANYQKGVQALADEPNVQTLARTDADAGRGGAALFITNAEAFLAQKALHNEMFGPAALLVACSDVAQLAYVTEHLEGQLTATLQLDEDDVPAAQVLLPALERRVGRILANGFPTGVEVATAMVHGGPFPATADGRSTSVGTAAIERFLRPVCYQDMPQALLPEALRDGNPLNIWRRRDGVLGKE